MGIPLLTDITSVVQWLQAQGVQRMVTDSRRVQAGEAFVAWPGAAHDGRQYVASALQAGAAACLVEQHGLDAAIASGMTEQWPAGRVAAVANLKALSGPIASVLYGEPSQHLSVLAVTGTNGKTSTTWWLAQALGKAPAQATGKPIPCGVIGTLGVGVPPVVHSTGMTTPDPVVVQNTLQRLRQDGLAACAMEASSIGIDELRLEGVRVRVAVFTNFTQDHLDYHQTMEAYWQAKRKLFAWPGLEHAVINTDDLQGQALAAELVQDALRQPATGKPLTVWTYGLQAAHQPTERPERHLQAVEVQHNQRGVQFTVCEGSARVPVRAAVIGSYNVLNLLAVIGSLRAMGMSLPVAAAACEDLLPVPGRMECIGAGPLAVVDYAHTPDALEQALLALRPLADARNGKLWCVFGCGGDRDPSKRPLMGAIAARHADQVVVTSDNPRSESPQTIIAQILLGAPEQHHVQVELDRAQAIAWSLSQAADNDVVLLAGKGHEATQEIAGQKMPFADQEHAQRALTQRAKPMATLQQLQQALQQKAPQLQAQLVGVGETPIARVHTDTRTAMAGDLFIALRGERFDANAFLHQAQAQGVAALLCHAGLPADAYPAGLPRIEVTDTTAALTALATAWRSQQSLPVIAVTGSNGKTTVTQMTASILRAHAGEAAWATRGNLNNAIGVPLTVLGLRSAHRMAVVELGMNHPGEIADLAAVAQPTVALVNNAQREHLEFMHTVQAVAEENGSVLQALPDDGVAVFPYADTYTPLWQALAGQRRTLRFGLQREADVHATRVQWGQGGWQLQIATPLGAFDCTLAIAGRHHVVNALAATACAVAAGVPLAAIAAGLSAFEPVQGRCRALTLPHPVQSEPPRYLTVVDDTYNANPDSVHAAIDVLADLPGPRLLVLGDMGEVGEQGPAFHAEAGAYAQACGIEHIWLTGELAQHAAAAAPSSRYFADMASLQDALPLVLAQASSVLVKGSRFMRMERVVLSIQAHTGTDTGLGEHAC
ncbi:bifunctional UDP-N-acetylmuramoyl-L-alanyl-D-glutamate--2,6-diaminopimelate ligase MurE/UDP-N-acetylmuramoyl-tripeptide--D-alanyl-D-alanine ligase MurF [Curvibacter sp. CHRR-16]|uniref:bifunctional UDP-N-acetylmuramoyl-L-alanyl-D-glutamate--2, 6-diaminopimelate ligase MurE/UDP-N-acetylmuramoyl-tripeptide--D-alanyl-D-alanine ligase MurF n=1 Tax=Curvibacter sp. CHRR-16 TaxID=2835872 RepID=UPI001BDA8788|nr:bifunctional UDP-N-acetylmuramoyl-L-alanyl-D-glutamate--2,6-diaminopimelate ligase MurE/UDP-N-acetylmuramoyl-tripeptide--D-alanyl-D-alanine ligase MurF [Curvibacter sp. CHRR-16]MBT0569970.1 bifunctional UDP-N-acetylmuramoyl-L-alanyl-D-glutamate--2,6-diaminopimelate ligase MurE/UDP-N-acetylmuramoyl-tripeptide--D-alanyl-D-alanine ligase MurF [Curvibacter sp. CHRR-16]